MYKRLRMKQCLSQREAAELLGISPQYLCMIEKKYCLVTDDIKLRMTKVYCCSLADLE